MTHNPEQARPSVLDRVKNLLESMHSRDPNIAGQWKAPFASEPCLTEQETEAWESANGVSLPQEYRLFLLEVGNGGRIPSSYCDFEIWPLGRNSTNRDCSVAFPIAKTRLNERMTQLRLEGRSKQARLFPELNEYGKVRPLPGCLYFGMYPGGDQVFMVVSGELSGTIWTAVDGGVPECDRKGNPFSFLTWFEDVLLEAKRWE